MGYVTKLNNMITGTEWDSKNLEDMIKTGEGGIFNNAAQIWNHSFYWKSMKQNGGEEPTGLIKNQIDKDFGSFEKFKDEFSLNAAGHFGSGWVWLTYSSDKKLRIVQTHDAGCPLKDTGLGTPLLTCDVWEHAYYVDYRNDRAAYIKAWWNLVNWDFANENLKSVM